MSALIATGKASTRVASRQAPEGPRSCNHRAGTSRQAAPAASPPLACQRSCHVAPGCSVSHWSSSDVLGDDPVAARTIAARIWDRTPGTAPPVQMANQFGMVFSTLDCEPRWRERLPEVPTLVVHGRRDRFFPIGNGEAIAREIPGARLLVLEEAATAILDAAAGEVAKAMLALG